MTTVPLPEHGARRAAFLEVAKGTEETILSSPGNRSVTAQSPDLSNGNSVHSSTVEFSPEVWWTAHERMRMRAR